jgi:hypothetical protein
MTPAPPIDWERVEIIMRKMPEDVTDQERLLVLRAFTEGNARYREIAQRIKRGT